MGIEAPFADSLSSRCILMLLSVSRHEKLLCCASRRVWARRPQERTNYTLGSRNQLGNELRDCATSLQRTLVTCNELWLLCNELGLPTTKWVRARDMLTRSRRESHLCV